MAEVTNPAAIAGALKLQQVGQDIAAMPLETIAAAAEAQGRAVEWGDIGEAITPLLSTAWLLALAASLGATFDTRAEFAALLRRFADRVERS